MELTKMLKFFLLGQFPNGLIGGLAVNIILSVSCFVSGFVVGLLLALGRTSRFKLLRLVCGFIVEIVRSVPLLLIVFWFFFVMPLVVGHPIPILTSGFFAVSMYSAVNQAEILRTGIVNFDKEQLQAAHATGLSRLQCLVYIVVPQVVQMLLPSFTGFFLSLFKDTSVLSIVGVIDLTRAGRMISERYPSDLFLCYGLMALIFFVACLGLSRLAKRLEEKNRIKFGS